MASVPDTNNKGSPYSQVELVVDIPDAASAEALRSSLTAIDSIKSISVKDDFRQFVVTSNLPVEELRQLMNERSGQRVVLMGFGSASKGQAGLEQVSSAVSAIQNCTGHSTVSGVVRFTENRPEGAAAHGDASGTSLIADGVIDGLKVNSRYCVAVHEFGDVSNEATSCGRVFEAPITKKPLLLACASAHGVMSRLRNEAIGRVSFRNELNGVELWQLIGRSVVVHQLPESDATQHSDGNAQEVLRDTAKQQTEVTTAASLNLTHRIAFGIIARAAAVFENTKRLCTCSGATIWQEHDEVQSKTQV